jgi:hypothetical protein
MQRPQIDTTGLPQSMVAIVAKRAASQWCYVTPDGRAFYVAEEHARGMQQHSGGFIFEPLREEATL